MRRIFMLLLSVSLFLVPCLGCGKSEPDPRDRPDFVDTTDPSKVGEMMGGEDLGPNATKESKPK